MYIYIYIYIHPPKKSDVRILATRRLRKQILLNPFPHAHKAYTLYRCIDDTFERMSSATKLREDD